MCSPWKQTPDTAKQLGITSETLNRQYEIANSFLENGGTYNLVPSHDSSINWNNKMYAVR